MIENKERVSKQLNLLQEAVNDVVHENDNLKRLTKEDEAQLNNTLRNIQESVILLNQQNYIISVNDAAKSSLGIEDDVSQVRIESYIKNTDFLQFIADVKEGKLIRNQEILIEKDHYQKYYEVSASKVDSDSGNDNQNLLIILHDITRLKTLETIRKDFVANVSHELRTPVTIIKGFSDTLIDDYEVMADSDKKRFTQKIHKNVDRLNVLLKDLLALSRLDSGSISVNREFISLSVCVNEAIDLVSGKLSNNQEILIKPASSIDKVMIDPVKIVQVVSNLLENAILHAEGFTEIQIHYDVVDDLIKFAIKDNGCGIPETDLSRIFERFYRVEKGRSRETGGTGLGLSIVKHLVQVQGGNIDIKSEQGVETTISFTISQ